MKDYTRIVIRFLFIFLFTFLFVKLISSFKQETSINKLTKSIKLVDTKVVSLEKNDLQVPVYGKLQSVNQNNIVCEVNGIFIGNNFKSGISFMKGDTLGYVNYDEFKNNLNSQKSILLNQVSKLVSEIKFDFPDDYSKWYNFMKRINFKSNLPVIPSISNEKFKNYLTGKNFYSLYFTVKSIEDRISKHVFIANFDGVLSDVSIKSGTAVVFGQKIGVFYQPKYLEFESSISLENALLTKPKMKVFIKSDELIDHDYGYVSRVNKTLNSNSQNMSVFIEVDGDKFFNGMYVDGYIIIGSVENCMLIDRSLLDGSYLYLIKDEKLVKKKVEILQIIENKAIIKGLKNNDVMLGESVKDSYEGMPVRIK